MSGELSSECGVSFLSDEFNALKRVVFGAGCPASVRIYIYKSMAYWPNTDKIKDESGVKMVRKICDSDRRGLNLLNFSENIV